MDRREILEKLVDTARAASEIVMRVYAEPDLGVELKGPNDPVTRADKEANAFILERLGESFPGVPIVAEESDPSTFVGFGDAPAALFHPGDAHALQQRGAASARTRRVRVGEARRIDVAVASDPGGANDTRRIDQRKEIARFVCRDEIDVEAEALRHRRRALELLPARR